VCYDLSGKELWKFELPPAVLLGDLGSGVSPILADGVVVVVRDQKKDSSILAVDVATGSVKWRRKPRSPPPYPTPVPWDPSAGKQVVVAGHARMIGYDLLSGAQRWSAAGVPSGCCSSPVTADGIVLFAGSVGGGSDESQMPTFDSFLKDLDANKDGALSREEA